MKKIFLSIVILSCYSILSGQTVTDHPIDLVGKTVEANEFIIFHTDGSSSSSPGTKTTIGRFDPNGGTLSQKIVEASSIANPSAISTGGGKFLNAIALDLNGDSYDEPVFVIEKSNGAKALTFPSIDKSNLTSSIDLNNPPNTPEIILPTPANGIVKLAKRDFDNDGKEELVVLTRASQAGGGLWLEIYGITNPPYVSRLKQQNLDGFAPLNNSDYEAFDLDIGDYDSDGALDLAVVAFEQGATSRQCFVQLYKVDPPSLPSFPSWGITKKGKLVLTPTGSANGWENVAITSKYDQFNNNTTIGIALAFEDPNNSSTIKRRMYSVITDFVPGVYDLNNPVSIGNPYSLDLQNSNRPAISMATGNLNSHPFKETIVAWDGEIQMVEITANNMNVIASSSVGNVQDNFYQLVKGSSYVSIGDVDYDDEKEVLVVTTDDDGNSGNPQQTLKVNILTTNSNSSSIITKGSKEIQSVSHSGSSSDYHFAAVLGEFQGGRARLKAPIKIRKKIFTPIIVNNSPPHHFDIVNGLEADLTDNYPNWPGGGTQGTMSSEYIQTTSNSQTLTTTVTDDWGVSASLSAGFSKLGNGIKGTVTGTYGEEFSTTNTNTSTFTLSLASTAKSDDQVYGIVQDIDFYEYPVDSSGVNIGYVLAMVREGMPIVQWMDSKSPDAQNYISDHEPGNLLSYPSSSNFNDYAGVTEIVKELPGGFNVGVGGEMNFALKFADFTSSGASKTRKFGAEVSTTISGSAKYFDVELEISGSYNRTEMTTHTSEVLSEVEFKSNLNRPLVSPFTNANYTLTPKVYWADNGALTLGYAVDPSLGNSFWSDNYESKPDLSMILPWCWDLAKGDSTFLTSPEKRRESKSIALSKTSFVAGDTIFISAFIHNFSLMDYTGNVEFQFYAENPDAGGTLLSDINGNTILTVTGGFPARERVPIQFAWKVPAGIPTGTAIYVVIDPNNQIDEVHEDNNTGSFGVGENITSIENEIQANPVIAKVFPNPAQDHAQLEMEMPISGDLFVDMLDMQGRTIKTLFEDDVRKGNYILPIDLSTVNTGYYFVRMVIGNHQKTVKLVKTD